MDKNRLLKRIVAAMLCIALVLVSIGISYVFKDEFNAATQNVQVSVTSKPTVDVMMTSKETKVNLETFEVDLRNATKKLGVDDSNFNFITVNREWSGVEANSLDFSKIVNEWNGYGALCWKAENNKIFVDIRGGFSNFNLPGSWSSYYPKGHNAGEGWGAALIDKDAFESNKIEADFTVDAAGNLHNGFAFNVTENPDKSLNGYFFSLCHHIKQISNYTTPTQDAWLDSAAFYPQVRNASYSLYLYRFDHWQPDRSWSYGAGNLYCCWFGNPDYYPANNVFTNKMPIAGGNATILADWQLPFSQRRNVKYHVEYNNGRILIKMNNKVVVDMVDNTFPRGSYGFWGNQCEQNASMRVSDFTTYVEKNYIKDFKSVLQEPTWRDEAHHVVVNIDDKEDATLTGQNDISEILSRTINDKIHFIQWGTNTNKDTAQSFITKNDGKGLFADNSNYTDCVNKTAAYIKSLIDQETESQYVIVGHDTNIDVIPASFKTGATSADYPNGRWFISHDYTKLNDNRPLANDTGLSTQAEFYSPNLVCNFDKPGTYKLKFDDADVKTVYAHRLPVAEFMMSISGSNVSLTSCSYDMDSNDNSRNLGRGIAAEKWSWKPVSSSSWTSGKMTSFDPSQKYIIKLEVQDYQGAWSYTTKYIGDGKPVAQFVADKQEYFANQPLIITDGSYDPNGRTITKRTWELKKDGVKKASGTTPIDNPGIYGNGNYTYTLTVESAGGISEPFTRAFTIVPDTVEPSILITPTSCGWKQGNQPVGVTCSDAASGFKQWRYAITTSQAKPSSGWSSYNTASSGTVTVTETNAQWLHIEAQDNAGNTAYRVVGLYKIDNIKPVIGKLDKEHLYSNNTVNITITASDAHSGLAGGQAAYGIATSNDSSKASWGTSNVKKVTQNSTYYLFARDYAGNVSNAAAITVTEITTKIPVTIRWSDNFNKHLTRPTAVKVTLKQNGSVFMTHDVTGDMNAAAWTYTFDELQVFDTGGKPYVYTLSYDAIVSTKAPSDIYKHKGMTKPSGSATTYSLYDINVELANNNSTPPSIPDLPPIIPGGSSPWDEIPESPYFSDGDKEEVGYTIKGTVSFDDMNDKLGYRPKKVILTLTNNGGFKAMAVLDTSAAKDSFEYKFTNLPKYDASLEAYQYTISENFRSQFMVNGKFVNAYIADSETKDAVYENGNTYSTVDFTNTFNHPKDGDEVDPVREWGSIALNITHDRNEAVNVTLKRMKTYYRNYETVYGDEHSIFETSANVDSKGTRVSKLMPGKYEVIIGAKDLSIKEAAIAGEGFKLLTESGKTFIIVATTKDDLLGALALKLSDSSGDGGSNGGGSDAPPKFPGMVSDQSKHNYFGCSLNAPAASSLDDMIEMLNLFGIEEAAYVEPVFEESLQDAGPPTETDEPGASIAGEENDSEIIE